MKNCLGKSSHRSGGARGDLVPFLKLSSKILGRGIQLRDHTHGLPRKGLRRSDSRPPQSTKGGNDQYLEGLKGGLSENLGMSNVCPSLNPVFPKYTAKGD